MKCYNIFEETNQKTKVKNKKQSEEQPPRACHDA